MKEFTGVKRFCLTTSFHGWKYIYSEIGSARSSIWLVVALAAFGGCGYFMIKNLVEFLNAKTLTR